MPPDEYRVLSCDDCPFGVLFVCLHPMTVSYFVGPMPIRQQRGSAPPVRCPLRSRSASIVLVENIKKRARKAPSKGKKK